MRLSLLYWMDPWCPATGGIESYTLSLIKHMPVDAKLELFGVTTDIEKRPALSWYKGDLDGRTLNFFPLYYAPSSNQRVVIPNCIRYTSKLAQCRGQISGDLIISHRPEPLLALRKDQRAVFVNHIGIDDIPGGRTDFGWTRARVLYDFLESQAIKRSATTFAVRERAAIKLKKKYPEHATKISFEPTWFDPIFASSYRNRASLIDQLGVPKNKYLIVTSARLDTQKNHDLILETLKELQPENLGFHWLFVGDGPKREYLERRASTLGVRHLVTFTGHLDQTTLANVLSACDLFVLPSHYEGMSISLLEAQACGLPVIVSKVGEAGRTIRDGENGRILNLSDTGSLAKAVIDQLTREKAVRGNSTFVERYNANTAVPIFFRKISSMANCS